MIIVQASIYIINKEVMPILMILQNWIQGIKENKEKIVHNQEKVVII